MMNTSGIIDHITNWLNDYATEAGANGFVVGISGGIDSAVTSTLCAKSGLKVICLEMGIHQNTDEVQRGMEHIKWLKSKYPNVSHYQLDLTELFETFRNTIPQKSAAHNLSMANSRARLRMTTLYAVAQSEGMLVAGTGNKVEDFGVGFFTKYGDGGVDLSPIADLNKTEVYKLAEEMKIIESIQTAEPTDGLWKDERTDEGQLGATYPELEWAMEFDGKSEDLSDREKEVLKRYNDFHSANKHKMMPIPVCQIPDHLK